MSGTSDLAFPDPRAARLFESVMIGNLALPNRLVMAPMGRLGSTVGVLGAPYSDYYGRLIMVAAPKAASAWSSARRRRSAVRWLSAGLKYPWRLKQVRGKAMAQRMNAEAFDQASCLCREPAGSMLPWTSIGLSPRPGNSHISGRAILATLTVTDLDKPPVAIDIGDLQADRRTREAPRHRLSSGPHAP